MKLRDNHHIVLTTPDIDRCLRFYHDFLSMEAHEKTGKSAYTSVPVKSR